VVYLCVVLDSLILHIVFQHFKISILSHRIDVVTVSPELSSPQKDFHLGVSLEHFSCRDAFYRGNHTDNPYVWNCLDKKMNMVFIKTNLEELVRVASG